MRTCDLCGRKEGKKKSILEAVIISFKDLQEAQFAKDSNEYICKVCFEEVLGAVVDKKKEIILRGRDNLNSNKTPKEFCKNKNCVAKGDN